MEPSTQLEFCQLRDAALDAAPPELPVGAVHLWKKSLLVSDVMNAGYELLSAGEREKAQRYRVEGPRGDFILTRGTLRSLLAGYLATTPHSLRFEYSEHGKPHLAEKCDLRFNVSHTDGLALLAFTRRREIGIDVERVRPQMEVLKIAERFFSPREIADLQSRSGDELDAAFFRCWTRKEAYIKARGEGLSLPLRQFDVSLDPSETRALLATRPDAAEAARWRLRDLPMSPGYAAALAVEAETQA